MNRLALHVAPFVALLAAAACGSSHEAGDAGRDAGTLDGGGATDAGPAPGVDAGPPRADTGPGRECPDGTAFMFPGCGEPGGIEIEPGCYQRCGEPGDGPCPEGLACLTTTIDPCVCEGGGDCCDACGAEVRLCLAPVEPSPCVGTEYCGCHMGCEPLIDLSTGCVCPCDEPFNCTGETCDCACGGAAYLGCAPAGACEVTEVHCELPCRAVLVDGCPVCDPDCGG